MAKEIKETEKKLATAVEKKAEEVNKKVTKASEDTKKVATKVVADAKKTAAKAETTVKKAASTAAAKATKTKDAEVFLQYAGQEVNTAVVIDRVKANFVQEGHKASDVKEVQVYLKPEDNTAYYVVNKKFAGQVDLF